jgi:DNA-binding CsgD family transcriptional regulator
VDSQSPPGRGRGGRATPLTRRETEVLRLIAVGCSTDKELAAALHVAPETAHKIVGRALRKSGTGNRVQLLIWVLQEGIADLSEPDKAA